MANENLVEKIEKIISVPKTENLLDNAPEKSLNNETEKLSNQKNTEKEGATIKETNEKAIPSSTASVIVDAYRVRREKEIDAFLSDGLSETFLAMSPVKQKIFKDEGEQTAKKINTLLDATKINISKIVKLIRRWLSLIIGVNHFFLDQEAKIKADKIIKIKNKF